MHIHVNVHISPNTTCSVHIELVRPPQQGASKLLSDSEHRLLLGFLAAQAINTKPA